jgi:hypothetical protein
MRKIGLDVSSLQVESFETADDSAKERGTVEGHSDNPYNSWYTCPETMCGEECLSGPNPCQPSAAWTNGQVACLCNDTSRCA